ncbi:MAG: 6-bladed beta-propeller [Dysgonamonadaceae bacterium]|jgi:hypothetical protein|nr:6-bladed beta-propeller [Dysgonamonadaceae bacterium]
MKKIAILFGGILLMFICSCNHKKNKSDIEDNNSTHIKVNLHSNDNIRINDYLQYTSFIVLETTNDNLISLIDKILFFKSHIYILDSKQGSIFIFDDKGKYLSKIDRRGEGPDEYITADDFVIDQLNNQIQIYDGTSGHIINYSYSGEFLDKKKVAAGYALTLLKNGNWLLHTGYGSGNQLNNLHNILLYDKDFKLIESFLPYNESLAGHKYTVATAKSVFSEYNNTTYILPLLSNNIYSYNENTNQMECNYKIIFSGDENSYIDENSTPLEIAHFRSQLINGEIASKIHCFYKTGSVVFFQFFYQKKLFFCLYNENTRETQCSSKTLFDDNGLFFVPVVYYSDKWQDKVLSIIDGELFAISKQMDKTNNPVIKEISKSIESEDTNPILVFYNQSN